jgi:hypothetical protein
MPRPSRGCRRCRQRRVRCDENQPSCRRCINRNELCEGYRDEASIIFRHETDKIIQYVSALQAVLQHKSKGSPQSSVKKRSKSISVDPSALAPREAASIKLKDSHSWLKGLASEMMPPVEEQAVDSFMGKYVIYPCNETSSPGFLEHLPSMFHEVNVNGRYALRWAVRAAAYADISKDQDSDILTRKALQCYGMALSALGDSLGTQGKVPDDADLMTIVILDIFEVGPKIIDQKIVPLLTCIDFIHSYGSGQRIACPRNGSDSPIARFGPGLQPTRLESFPTCAPSDSTQIYLSFYLCANICKAKTTIILRHASHIECVKLARST